MGVLMFGRRCERCYFVSGCSSGTARDEKIEKLCSVRALYRENLVVWVGEMEPGRTELD